MLPDGAFPVKLPNEHIQHARQELENEMRLRGTIGYTALQSPDQFHNKHFVMPIFVFYKGLVFMSKAGRFLV